MSDFVSTLTDAVETVSGLADLAFGAAGGVVLGDFSFAGFEVPEQISFGGKQEMTIHRLPGGERVIDLLGPDPMDISWSGTFIDDDPVGRAQQLDQMRIAGDPMPLTWSQFSYTVIIRDFSADIRYSMVPYKISCVVQRDDSQSQPDDGDADLAWAVDDDTSEAADGYEAVGTDVASTFSDDVAGTITQASAAAATVLGTAQTVVSGLGSLIPGSSVLAQAQATLAGVQGTLATVSSGVDAALGVLDIASSSDLMSAMGMAQVLAQTVRAGSYIGRAVKNLS